MVQSHTAAESNSPRPNLMVMYSPDMERSVQFYSQLGLNFVKDRHGKGPEHYSCEAQGCVVEIYPVSPTSPATRGLRWGLNVANVDAIHQVLLNEDGVIVSPPTDSPWGRRMVVNDPDGNRVELTQSS